MQPSAPTQEQQREAMESQLYSLLGLSKGPPAELLNAPTAEEIEASELASLRQRQNPQAPQHMSDPQATTQPPTHTASATAVREQGLPKAQRGDGGKPRGRRQLQQQRRSNKGSTQTTSDAVKRAPEAQGVVPPSSTTVAPTMSPVDVVESIPPAAAAVAVEADLRCAEGAALSAGTDESDDTDHEQRHQQQDSGDGDGGNDGGGASAVKKSKPQLHDDGAMRLTRELESLFMAKAVPPAEMASRQSTVKRLQSLMDELFPTRNPKLHLFGSSVNGFGFAGADMDMCLVLQGLASDGHGAIVETLEKAFRALDYSNILALPKARVPVIKFTDPATGLGCDICFNNGLALRNSQLLAAYASLDARVRPLAFAVKTWAKARRVNNTFEGTLSSYAYVMLVIHFLQYRRPAVLPTLQNMTALRNRNRPHVMVSGFDTYVLSATHTRTRTAHIMLFF